MARSKSSRKSGKTARKPTKSKTKAPRRGYSWGARLLALGLLVILVGGVYLARLDHEVRLKFDGKRWALPARVYARALEVYPMAEMGADQLQAELKRLGYRRTPHPDSPGEYSSYRGRFLVHTRGFAFWDTAEPRRSLELDFADGMLKTLRDRSTGAQLPLVRLEPPLIGSIYPAHHEDRILVRRQDLPEALVQGLIAVEDQGFYEHHGVDPLAIARAVWVNLSSGRLAQGGSTLTQQLVKNFYLTSERTVWRKLNEAAMALLLELHYDKDAILEAYANEIFLGQDGSRAIHGFGLASQFYFNRPLEELGLAQQALLVALPRGPSYYDPRRHPQRARQRRNLVLDLMAQQGFIEPDRAEQAKGEPLGVSRVRGLGRGRYPAFLDLVRRQLHRDYREEDLTSEGLQVFTTLDPWLQGLAENGVSQGLDRLEKDHGLKTRTLEAAMVVADSQGGELLALVGGREARYAGFNRALEAVRPIGSLAKPAVYLTALAHPRQYGLTTLLDDSRVQIKGADGSVWTPDNYDKRKHGRVPLHQALAHSYNLATVHLGMDLGLEAVADTLQSLGVSRPFQPYPSILLGALSLSPLEVTQVYQTLAAGGFRSPLRAIREVTDREGTPLQRYPVTVERVVPAGPVYLVDRVLQEVVREGTARSLSRYIAPELGVAGKTGTTDELRDSWFAGFTGDKVAVVWVGRDDNAPAGLSGSRGALPIWGRVMREAHPTPVMLFPPEDVELVWIDPANGLRADESCEDATRVPFLEGGAPTLASSCMDRPGSRVLERFRRFFE
jgi:penicillin-binding protein 1B